MHLTDEQWQVVAPLIPPPSSAAGRGRPLIDERAVLDGILWKFSTDSPWSLSSPNILLQTCVRRYHNTQRTGLFTNIIRALLIDLRDRGNLDYDRHFLMAPFSIQSTTVRQFLPLILTLKAPGNIT